MFDCRIATSPWPWSSRRPVTTKFGTSPFRRVRPCSDSDCFPNSVPISATEVRFDSAWFQKNRKKSTKSDLPIWLDGRSSGLMEISGGPLFTPHPHPNVNQVGTWNNGELTVSRVRNDRKKIWGGEGCVCVYEIDGSATVGRVSRCHFFTLPFLSDRPATLDSSSRSTDMKYYCCCCLQC
jgi:hypothetical protein